MYKALTTVCYEVKKCHLGWLSALDCFFLLADGSEHKLLLTGTEEMAAP